MKILLSILLSSFVASTALAAPEAQPTPTQPTSKQLPPPVSQPTKALPYKPAPIKQQQDLPPMVQAPSVSPTAGNNPSQKEGSKNDENEDLLSREKYNQIVDGYKQYLSTVKKEIREEIREYRKEIAKINKEKIELYKKLSQEAQNFLAKEREFKKQLPIKHRHKMLNEARNTGTE